MVPFTEYIEQANRERFIVLQVEDYEAMDELDEIAALEGYDILFFGPGDFSHSLGIPAQFDDPRIKDARLKVAEAARKHGKFAGTVGSIANHQELIAMGYQFINLGADVLAWSNYCKEILAAWNKEDSGKSGYYK
jgi:4-hydroxy-2-oxoheptanedioate aldolase